MSSPALGNPSLESRLEGGMHDLHAAKTGSPRAFHSSAAGTSFSRDCAAQDPRAEDAGFVAVITVLRFTPGKRIEDESRDGGVETCLAVRM